MQDILEFLEGIFQWTFGLLQMMENKFNVVVIILLAFGLGYWTFYWQKRYNKEAAKDANQLL
jgi:hypothetical protein